ncbi:MAG: hypothetical protein HY927_03445 [Elusimicrobia bacterium]|nr:hypothetical protein [Elusimicrobiota bacterium]
MRWTSLLQVVALAGAAMGAPQLFGPAGLDQKSLSAMVSTLAAARSGQGLDAQADAQLQALKSGRLQDVPLDKLAALSDLSASKQGGTAPAQGDIAAAVLKALKEERPSTGSRLQGEILRLAESLRKFYLRYRDKALAVMAVLGLFTVAVLFLGLVPIVRFFAKFYLTFLYGICCYWLMWLALAMFAFCAASRLNPWPIIPQEFFYVPAGYLLLTGMFIRLLDPNYPLWNTLLKGLGSTILSCASIAGYGFFR